MTHSPVLSTWCLRDGEPAAWVIPVASHPRCHHPLAGWRMKAEVYFNGHVRAHSAEFGPRYFSPAPFHGTVALPRLAFNGAPREVNFAAEAGARWVLGPGFARGVLPFAGGALHLEALIPHLDAREVLLKYAWRAAAGAAAPDIYYPVNLGETRVNGPCVFQTLPHYGCLGYAASGGALGLRGRNTWKASLAEPFFLRVAYDPAGACPAPLDEASFEDARARRAGVWRGHFQELAIRPGCDPVEIMWSAQLLLGSGFYDAGRGFHCATNGHAYLFNQTSAELDQPHGASSFRDGNQVAWGVARCAPGLARGQVLRSAAAGDAALGIPQMSNATPGAGYAWKAPGGSAAAAGDSTAIASEQAWWWMLALAAVLEREGKAFLATPVTASDGFQGPLSGHLARMLDFARNRVGVGPHGLPRFLSGDWNDWLGAAGCGGRGESFMNAGLAVFAQEQLALALERLDSRDTLAPDLRGHARALRDACLPHSRGDWWPRAFNDAGRLIGGAADNRVYLDAQPWMSLAKIGGDRARKLRAALRRCATPIGPALVDRPLGFDEFAGHTHCRYPGGCGENGGVWWIAGQWMALALDAEGCADEAMALHHQCSRANHHRLFPGEWWSPFMAPDGIDAPASPHFGRPQQSGEHYPEPWAEGCPREDMPPHEVAKWSYQLAFATAWQSA